MENCCTDEDDIFIRLLTIFLKLLLITVPLFANKYIYDFRVNQDAILKLFTIILIAIWMVKMINTGKYSLQKTKLDLPIILFFLVLILSLFISKTETVSIQDFIIFFSYILIFFLITNNLNRDTDFNSFIYLFFIISSLVSIYTIIQYYGFDPYLSDLHILTSTIGQKNWISNYLAMIFPIAFSYFLLEQTIKIRILYFLFLSILYATLMICQSRGIWISISLTIILAIYIIIKFKLSEIFKRNKKRLILLLVTFLIITIVYSTDNPLEKSVINVTERALSTFDEQDPSINMHILTWKTTLEMIKDRPIFGSGIGTFKMNYLDYQAEFLQDNPYYVNFSGKSGEAHNEYLQMGAEIGIIGLVIFIGFILMFYSIIINYFKKNDGDKDKIIVFGLVLGITCFLIHCLFTFPLHVPALGVTFFALLGLTVIYMKNNNLHEIGSGSYLKEKKWINKNIKIALNILIFIFMICAVNLLVMKPYIAELYYFKGMRYNVDKNYIRSLPNFKYAVQLDPYNGRILHALGTTYYNLNIFSKAEEILQEVKKYMIDVNTFYILGLNYSKLNMLENAEKEFKHAIYLDSKYVKAYIDLAYLYAKQEEYDKAIAEWNKILEIDPNFTEKYNILYFIGMAYQKKQMPDQALEYFYQALELNSEGDPIEKEIEQEINKIYKSKLEN